MALVREALNFRESASEQGSTLQFEVTGEDKNKPLSKDRELLLSAKLCPVSESYPAVVLHDDGSAGVTTICQ